MKSAEKFTTGHDLELLSVFSFSGSIMLGLKNGLNVEVSLKDLVNVKFKRELSGEISRPKFINFTT